MISSNKLSNVKVIFSLATVLKCLLGIFFIVSAMAKFVSIENFNIYVFSFGLLPFNLSVLVGWLAVSTELVLGVALLTNRHHNIVCLLNALLLIGFTLFLGYAWFAGRSDSCHCMGELLPFDPLRSMVKNAILLFLLFVVWKYAEADRRQKWWIALICVLVGQGVIVVSGFMGWIRMNFFDLQYSSTLAAIMAVVAVLGCFRFSKRWWVELLMVLTPYVAVFILSTAACIAPVKGNVPVNSELLMETISDAGQLSDMHIKEGRKVVSFYSKGCRYCRRTSETISMIQKRHNLDAGAFVTVFPGDAKNGLDAFYSSLYAVRYAPTSVDDETFLQITYGSAPLVVLLDNGKVVDTYGVGYVSESKIVDFLSQSQAKPE